MGNSKALIIVHGYTQMIPDSEVETHSRYIVFISTVTKQIATALWGSGKTGVCPLTAV